ncbi:hypothetical protein [Aureivirga sp. CE67]|uniref:hypothetical protein n=1 Tax=Aureivirga sp. CE67 TaxID=1788983 RepID=UPI0018C9888D|nr:hypothetical protein [Aureivirga sp. CE67]
MAILFLLSTWKRAKFSSKPILDARLKYSYLDVVNYLNELKGEGRKLYQNSIKYLDMIFPLLYAALFIFSYLKIGCWKPDITINKMIFLFPILAMIFDYSENINILYFLKNHPNYTKSKVNKSSFMTQLKWFFILISIAFVLLYLVL